MMINLILKFCEHNHFKVKLIEVPNIDFNVFLVVPNDSDVNQEYFIVVEPDLLNDQVLQEIESRYSEDILDFIDANEKVSEAFKKNTTLILCYLEDSVSKRELLKFEESPYHFKKNAIQFSKEEVDALTEELNIDFSNQNVNKLLAANSGQSFENFKKKSKELEIYYPLLMRLVTKLPFIHYVPSTNQLESIDSFVEGNLNKEELELLDLINLEEESDASMDAFIKRTFLTDE